MQYEQCIRSSGHIRCFFCGSTVWCWIPRGHSRHGGFRSTRKESSPGRSLGIPLGDLTGPKNRVEEEWISH